MNINLEGKRAIVTGAGKGIGRAISQKLVECGVDTYAISRTQADLDSLKDEFPSVHVIQLELKDWERTREEMTKIGPVDLLVNNAGVVAMSPFLEMSKEDFDNVMEVNFKAAYNVAQVVAKGMVENGKPGSIVNMSSTGSTRANYGISVYCPCKAALDMLTKCMALELGPKQIRVNAVNPTLVWTPMTLKYADYVKKETNLLELTPLGHFAEIEDVVNTVMFLLSDKSAMITGECVKVDGGICVH